MENIQNIRKYVMFCVFTFICLARGCFENRFLYFAGMITAVLLVIHALNEQNAIWNWSAYLICMTGLPVCALLSLITAVDRGMAVLGLLRILAICTVGMYIFILTGRDRNQLLMALPKMAGITLAVSYMLCFIPDFHNKVFMSHRLAGCFGYSNTYALFLLLACIVLLRQTGVNVWGKLLLGIWLLSGIVLTGSKAVMGLTVACGVMYAVQFFLKKQWKLTVGAVAVFACVLLAVGMIAISFGSSTFWGRLLYWKDMFPVIVTHPFGTGYLGFYYMQSAIQTGVYDASFLHNSILQLASDYGWGAMALFCYLIWASFRHSRITALQKELLVIMLLHYMFDFDLEYLPVWVVFFLCVLPPDDRQMTFVQKKYTHKNRYRKAVNISFFSVLCILFLYFNVTERLYAGGNTESAMRLYPWNTEWNLQQMANMDNIENAASMAEQITEQNAYAFLAYEAKALAYADDNEWEQAVEYQTEAVRNSKYRLEGYKTLLSFLQQAALDAIQEKNIEQAATYVKRMKEMPENLKDVESEVSWLGRKISEQPELQLDETVLDYLNRL